MTTKKLGRCIALWLVMGCIGVPATAIDAPIRPDRHAEAERKPHVTETANGIPLVHISAPAKNGVSRNEYEAFNVPDTGAILNNSYTMSETKLAGYVQGNLNMANGAATVIVNEVTSANPTAMNGFLEVAGKKASVVIANPNGITVNGGGFINTDKAILTTGKPVYSRDGGIRRFDVRKGIIGVDGKGLNAEGADHLAMLTRAMQLNAALWAKDVHIVTGSNAVDAETFAAKAIDGEGEKPEFLLDSTAIGGMYAGRICFVGTEKGLGVNNGSTWQALDTLTLDGTGHLTNTGRISSVRSVEIHVKGLSNNNVITAKNTLLLRAENTIKNRGTMAAGADENGAITNEGSLDVLTHQLDNEGGMLLAGKHAALSAESVSNYKGQLLSKGTAEITAKERINNNEGLLYTGGSTSLQAAMLHNEKGQLLSGGKIKGELGHFLNGEGTVSSTDKLSLHTRKDIDNTEGVLHSRKALEIAADTILNGKGEISSAGQSMIYASEMSNRQGIVLTGEDIQAEIGGTLNNKEGIFQSGQDTAITARAVNLDGVLLAGRDLAVTTGTNVTNEHTGDKYGITKAGRHLSLATTGTITNAKSIEAGGTISLQGISITNTTKAAVNGANVNLEAKEIRNNGLMHADGTLKAKADALYNLETGRIYGDRMHLKAAHLENRTDAALENKLSREMGKLKDAERELETAFSKDITAFTTDAEKEAYFQAIKEKSALYDGQKEAVEAAKQELANHKAGTIAARIGLTIVGKTLLNSGNALLYSGGDMQLSASKSIDNSGSKIKSQGDMTIKTPNLHNRNSAFSAKRILGDTVTNPEQIQIDQAGHPEQGQVFPASEFSSLTSGYGAYHNQSPDVIDELDEAVYVTITAADVAESDGMLSADLIGKPMPSYEYDDPLFKQFGVATMKAPRPAYGDPKQVEWDAAFEPILEVLNEKIFVYNENARAYNAPLEAAGKVKIKDYTIIRTNTTSSHNEVQTSKAGTIQSGGHMDIGGNVTNENSKIMAGKALAVSGAMNNEAFHDQKRSVTFGTTQQSYTKKRGFPHKSRRRRYRDRMFMTPHVELGKETPIGIAIVRENSHTSHEPIVISDTERSSINPKYSGIESTFTNVVSQSAFQLPESSLYTIHTELEAKYIVETDPVFTNKKKFLSSDYMLNQLKWDADRQMKRLGDGFYEQELVREQLIAMTGHPYADNHKNDEDAYRALMDTGILFAREQNLSRGSIPSFV